VERPTVGSFADSLGTHTGSEQLTLEGIADFRRMVSELAMSDLRVIAA